MVQYRSFAKHLLLALSLAAASPAAAPAANLEGLFSSVEFRTAPLAKFAGWDRIRHALRAERSKFRGCALHLETCPSAKMQRWNRLATAAENLPERQKLALVNNFFNRWHYRADADNYGKAEYWAGPTEFMSRSGDCEDYAVTKFFALRLLGFRDAQMRIVVVRDRNRGINHAVLAVRQGADSLILDNLSDRIVSHRAYPNYVARISFNEASYWAHLPVRHFSAKRERISDRPT